MEENGQFSADLLFATLILLVIITSIINVVSNGMSTANDAGFSKAQVLADDVARNINTVYNDGPGSYSTITLPSDFIYSISIDTTGVSVKYNNDPTKISKSSIIAINNLDPNSLSSMNPGKTYNITNNNGKILIKIT